MRTLLTLSLLLYYAQMLSAQIINREAFLQGKFVEVGLRSNGSHYTTDSCAPPGYHVRGKSIPLCQLGFIADAHRDGWDRGLPDFYGEYFTPGGGGGYGEFFSVENSIGKWATKNPKTGVDNFLQIKSIIGFVILIQRAENGTLAIWKGKAGSISITQRTFVPRNGVYFHNEVTLANDTNITIQNVYYMRSFVLTTPIPAHYPDSLRYNPDSVKYKIPYQHILNPKAKDFRTMVEYEGNLRSYLGLGTDDCRARACITFPSFSLLAGHDLIIPDKNLKGTWNYPYDVDSTELFFRHMRAGLDYSTRQYSQYFNASSLGANIIWNLGTLAPGESTSLKFAYVLSADDLSAALRQTLQVQDVERLGYTGGTVSLSAGDFYEALRRTGSRQLSAVRIDALPAAGAMSLDGTALRVGQRIAHSDLSRLRYACSAAGEYRMEYAVFDTTMCSERRGRVIFRVAAPPRVRVSGSDTLCGGGLAVAQALGSGGFGRLRYRWQTGDTLSEVQTSLTAPGRYVYRVEVADSLGTSATDSAVVWVGAVPRLILSPSDTIVEEGGQVRYVTSRATPSSVRWSADSGTMQDSILTAPILELTEQERIITIKAAAKTALGCSDSTTAQVRVIPRKALRWSSILTPNGDGKNDALIFLGLERFGRAKLTAFSRYGHILYHSDSYQNSTPIGGQIDGRRFEGTFYFVLEVEGFSDVIKGAVTVLWE